MSLIVVEQSSSVTDDSSCVPRPAHMGNMHVVSSQIPNRISPVGTRSLVSYMCWIAYRDAVM